MNNTELKEENKNRKIDLKKLALDFRSMGVYFLIFAAAITFSEIFLRYQISGHITKTNLAFLAFVPAEAMLFTVFAGFFKDKGNRITLPILLFIVGGYYCIQFFYFKTFGSLFSVTMMEMGGDAVGNFLWAMKGTFFAVAVLLFVLLLPVVISIVLAFIRKIKYPGYPVYMHLLALVFTIILWFCGIGALKLQGTGRQSAYYAFKNSSADTDTTAKYLGAMATFTVEAGAYYLGIGTAEETEELASVDRSSLELVAQEPIKETVTEHNEPAYTESTVSEEAAEMIEEPVVYEPWVDSAFDFQTMAENASDDSSKKMYTYLAEREPSYKNEYTGYFEDYNLIYICAESFWTYACDERVTPTLYKMANNGIVLDNFYNSFLNTTTNGEFAFTTSLWPDVSRHAKQGTDVGSFPQSSGKFMPYGIGDFFVSDGVPTYAFHDYYGTYYRRNLSWPNIGFENCKFMGKMKFTSCWPASDLEMMEQSVDDYIGEDRFFAYYMTFSGHGPYSDSNYMARKNIGEVKSLLGDDAANYNSQALYYLACNLELDKAMAYLEERLAEEGKLDKTVIVLTGDHYPYYLSEGGRTSLCGKEVNGLDQFHSTCIIYNSAIETPIHNEEYCCNVDIVPTVLNLFNIPFDSRLLMGTDVFSTDSMHTALLYNKSFLNDTVEYDSAKNDIVWKIDTEMYDEEDLDNYLENYLTLNDLTYLAGVNMVEYNFYLTAWKDAGLITEEEIAEEKKRASEAMAADAAQNARDAEAAEAARLRQEAEAAEAAAAEAMAAEMAVQAAEAAQAAETADTTDTQVPVQQDAAAVPAETEEAAEQ
ncbi:MAG: LTA synthase family protein [Lachnospiraceae bacterium]|nr:LTA synthase family protein [Lachnospiraceae bacterium]